MTFKDILKGSSMYALARKTGVPYSTVHDLFSGKADPENITLGSARKLAEGLDMSLEDFGKLAARDKITSLPEHLRPAFWDSDFEHLDLEKNRDFIITRLFTKGGIPGINWAEKTFTADEIRAAARTRRDLNPIVANFLSQRYGIPRRDMMYYRTRGVAIPWDKRG